MQRPVGSIKRMGTSENNRGNMMQKTAYDKKKEPFPVKVQNMN